MERTQAPALAADHFFLPDLCGRRAVGVVVLVAELLAIVLSLTRTGFGADLWGELGLTSLFVQWVALTTAMALCALRKPLANMQRQMAATIAWGVVVVDALVFSLLTQYAYIPLLGPLAPQGQPSLDAVAANVCIAAIIGGLVLRYFYVQEQLRLQQEAELQARIQALQSRIRPHFLFNSMNIIASLIVTDPRTAEGVVEDLADLFRASLKDAGNEVTLAHELDLCRRYIRIEQLRMGNRLKVDWQLDDTPLNDLRIPLLTLQPLLENAVYHGIQPLAEGGTVTVQVTYGNGVVRIRVTNPVGATVPADRGESAAAHRGNRMALENIRHRLQALYGPGARITAGRDGDSYGTELQYPFNISR